jgi:hypothetical protein
MVRRPRSFAAGPGEGLAAWSLPPDELTGETTKVQKSASKDFPGRGRRRQRPLAEERGPTFNLADGRLVAVCWPPRAGRMAVAPSPPTWRLARSGPPPSGASQPGAAATPTTVRHRDFYRTDLVHAPIQLQPPGRSAGVQPAAPYRRSARSRSTVASSWTVTSAAVMAAHSLSSHGVALAVLPARSPAVRPAAAMTMIDIDPVTTMRRRGLPAGFAVRRQTRVLLAGHRRGFSLAGPEYRGSRACRPGHHSARRPLPSHAVAGAP